MLCTWNFDVAFTREAQSTKYKGPYSTIRNRCGTLATAPRIEAVSGRSTI
jgi:hypothetical protein